MSAKLRLGPLPKTEVVRMTITLPAKVKADLDRYAALYTSAFGEPVDAAVLAPHMLAAFMDHDRAFRRARQGTSLEPRDSSSSPFTSAATSRTAETSGDGSPSR